MKGSLNLWLAVVVVVCGLSFWFGKDLVLPTGAADESRESRPEKVLVAPVPASEPVYLLVLNGTDKAGLAREFGLLLGKAGCVTEKVGNAPHDHFTSSFLVNRRLSAARAEQLAAELGGVPVLREFDGRSATDAVLVLGQDAARLRDHLQGRD